MKDRHLLPKCASPTNTHSTSTSSSAASPSNTQGSSLSSSSTSPVTVSPSSTAQITPEEILDQGTSLQAMAAAPNADENAKDNFRNWCELVDETYRIDCFEGYNIPRSSLPTNQLKLWWPVENPNIDTCTQIVKNAVEKNIYARLED